MTRDKAKKMFREDVDAYGKPKKIMTKIDKIFDYFESMICKNCKHYTYMSINNSFICSNLENQSVKFVDGDFGCNMFERSEND